MIELLLVVAIMAIVAYITIPSYISSQSKQKLTNSAKEVLRILNEARNRAIAGLAIEGSDLDGDQEVEPTETSLPGAFGVYFQRDLDLPNASENTSRAVLFGDQDGDWEFDPNVDMVIEELEFPYVSKIYNLELLERAGQFTIKHDVDEAIVFYRVPTGDVALRMKDASWSDTAEMQNLQWLRVDLAMWQMADADNKVQDTAYLRGIVAHSVSDYAYMCSTIETYNDDSTACTRD